MSELFEDEKSANSEGAWLLCNEIKSEVSAWTLLNIFLTLLNIVLIRFESKLTLSAIN